MVTSTYSRAIEQAYRPIELRFWIGRALVVLPWLVPVLLTLGLRLAIGPVTVDDAYITFRYARNLGEGTGFVYNVGHFVLGTTTPLYTLLLAGLYRIGLTDLPSVAWLMNATLDAISAWLLYQIAAQLRDRWAGFLAATLFALAAMSIAYSVGGMETSLFILLLIAGLELTIVRHTAWAAAVLGLATLTRPEGILAAGLLLGSLLIQRRRLPWAEAAGWLATVVPWLAFATWYFGAHFRRAWQPNPWSTSRFRPSRTRLLSRSR